MQLTLESFDEFASVARQLGFIPNAEAGKAAQEMARSLCAQAGVKVSFPGDPVAEPAANAAAPVTETEVVAEEPEQIPRDQPAEPKKRKSRDAKADVINDQPKPGEDIAGNKLPAADAPAAPDHEAARAALRNLAAKKDMPTCAELLKDFEVVRVKDLPAEKIADFVEKANAKANAKATA